jgi:acyl-coenzyme A thioesterase PaaI-like protein
MSTNTLDAPGRRLAGLWQRLAPWPGGSWLFSRLLGFMVPYTGSIGAHVRTLEPGHAVVTLRDRRAVRNHLRSVHAIALVNLAEVTSGLAMLVGLPAGVRGIVTGLSIEYRKKARGTLTASCRTTIPEVHGRVESEVIAEVRDPANEIVALATVRWRLEAVQQ